MKRRKNKKVPSRVLSNNISQNLQSRIGKKPLMMAKKMWRMIKEALMAA
jgi:hypothetical protein